MYIIIGIHFGACGDSRHTKHQFGVRFGRGDEHQLLEQNCHYSKRRSRTLENIANVYYYYYGGGGDGGWAREGIINNVHRRIIVIIALWLSPYYVLCTYLLNILN